MKRTKYWAAEQMFILSTSDFLDVPNLLDNVSSTLRCLYLSAERGKTYVLVRILFSP